ncbi:hypothetical protein [Novosphingobium beihaiensis]|uniref:Uncharacterized protein n=1 Tax=Novosphingobium beihaiensis TaxID=2930389 RepID=A0ABT0BM93_9SPHN|nr:hypothetical protein [Novosphingobium beihaiensis]MCJ2186175.1 hypothetical protein [Novosphingobium beihaiensis]
MSQSFEFYDSRAREAAAEAAAAKLDNVRQRALRSEATWRGLADKAKSMADRRAVIQQEKADARAEEMNFPE